MATQDLTTSYGAGKIRLAAQAKDLTGERFGLLTVIAPVARGKNGDAIWLAKCECGGEIRDRAYNLRQYRGCGCRKVETGERSLLHGHARHTEARSPTYISWRSMLTRCSDPKHQAWKYYGALGVKVCERWKTFANFLADMGERPDGRTIDRINPYGDYEPGNCRWATSIEQRHNRRVKP